MMRVVDDAYVRIHESLNVNEQRNNLVSIASGTLFFFAWWLIIDVAAGYPSSVDFNRVYLIIGAASTLSLIMINSISSNHMHGDSFADGCIDERGARAYLFIGLLIGFGALISSVWILFETYVIESTKAASVWPGVWLLAQNVLIFLAAMLLKFGRDEENAY